MTKEEYENLLKSDYWKGYSYSLIKERNFTCEDCGLRYYNERNKLQVHHLVYRDTNPWSYKPEELVVLCEKCHKKRHGILSESEQESSVISTQDTIGNHAKSYSYSTDSDKDKEDSEPYINNRNKRVKRYPYKKFFYKPRKKIKFKYYLYGILLFIVLLLGIKKPSKQVSTNNKEQTERIIKTSSKKGGEKPKLSPSSPIVSHHKSSNNDFVNDSSDYIGENEVTTEISEQSEIVVEEEHIKSNENLNSPQNKDNKDELL